MRILDEVPETLRVWYKQRKRWAICTALWGRTYIGKAMHTSRKAFWSLAISGIVFPLPFITALLAVLAVIFSPLGAATGLSSAWPIIVSVGLFLACGLLHWHYARKYHAKFSWLAFIPYSLIYLPIWGASSAIGSIMVSRGSLPSLDWKYSPNPPKTSDPPKAN
jgi:cellulose synthase/poly-beta-1,6-N-acetylglucosamine synthase-like glycosyltransferase